jgi:hypothetical protein
MTAYLLTVHLINLLAPAALMAWLVAFSSRFLGGFFASKDLPAPATPGLPVQVAVNFAVGAGVLLAGLLVLGRDAKMMTYLALTLTIATSQWWQLGAGRKGWKAFKNLYIRNH